ncbi:MAG: UDP-glucose 4-epimerase GalE [Gammaproteobacteria bacterium RIFOXYA12_FULL_61_12]|nr:MAG: UDP-glucose 4-epimerase GalE [Gammaproteobacteria bacterium RIFOXYD12_FULL_61_37]OGT94691.1 MAG: UDP-glucose 4-epimerase GalE [Gammaproteobacteria bacterium RIFOXYA12_FULL_61_12]
MNVLLTGGTGYIGSHTAVVLSQLGHEVVLYDNLSNSSDAVLEKIAQIVGQDFPFVRGDVRDTELLRNTLASHSMDAVIHFAGLKAVGESVAKPVDYYANNVQGTISLLQAMQAQQVKSLVFSSSATVYGQPQYLPLDENHPTSATNPYGRSKLYIEEMLKDVASSDHGWRIACLRYFNPVGAHQSGLIGENPNGLPNNLMPYIAQVAAGQRSELGVFGDDYPTNDGTGVRDYIHVMDLAEGHAAALDFLTKTTGWHAINLGTGKGYSVLEMVGAFERASSRKVPYRMTSRRAGDVAECYANPKRAGELFKWTARRSLDDMCASTWRFQQSVELGGS